MADEELPAGWEKRLSRTTGVFIIAKSKRKLKYLLHTLKKKKKPAGYIRSIYHR